MKKLDNETYSAIYNPKLNRRQKIAFDSFHILNRERNYISTGMGAMPINIKKLEIKAYWDQLIMPISFTFFLLFIQALDDVFISHSLEQAKAS